MNRRELIGTTATALMAAAAGRSAVLAQLTSAPASSAASASRAKLRPFSYADVKLTAGPLKDQYDYALNLFLKLEEDRILKVYRDTAGLPAPGPEMGGWYDAKGFGPGHALGQWMSALSRFAAAGSAEGREKVGRLVEGFGATVGRGKPFYEYRFPCYTYDKHVIGLTDAYRYAGIDAARDVLKRTTDVALPYLPEKALTREEMAARPHKDVSYTWDESYTMPENLFIAHGVFGDERYLEMAKRFLHDEPYFDKLARGEPAMVGKHAYSHVNALGSAAMAYLSLGVQKHFDAIRNAWDMIVRDQQYASGGWGPKEEFVQPGKGKLFESLSTTRNHFETPCGSYATMKLSRYLTQITGNSIYGDGLERVLYNGILAAKRLQPDGSTFYYSDYQNGARKVYHPDKWPCCSGTYPQAIADYVVSAYFHDDRDVYVNLYVPSELRWKRPGGEVRIVQETTYPHIDAVTFTVDTEQPADFAVKVRIPAWANDGAIQVNGTLMPPPVGAGWHEVRRTWKRGDKLVLHVPLEHRVEPIDAQHPNTVAIMRGPVMQVGVVADQPSLLQFDPPVATETLRFVPFYKIGDETYTTYFTQG